MLLFYFARIYKNKFYYLISQGFIKIPFLLTPMLSLNRHFKTQDYFQLYELVKRKDLVFALLILFMSDWFENSYRTNKLV